MYYSVDFEVCVHCEAIKVNWLEGGGKPGFTSTSPQCLSRFHYNPGIFLLRFQVDFTSISLQCRFAFEPISLWVHFDLFIGIAFAVSLLFRYDFPSLSIGCHIDFISVSLGFHLAFTSVSFRLQFIVVRLRIEGNFVQPWWSCEFPWSSLRFLCVVTPSTHRFLLRIDFGVTSTSLRSFVWVSLRFHFEYKSISLEVMFS